MNESLEIQEKWDKEADLYNPCPGAGGFPLLKAKQFYSWKCLRRKLVNDHGNGETELVGTHQYSTGENVAFLMLTTVHEMMNRSTVDSKKKP